MLSNEPKDAEVVFSLFWNSIIAQECLYCHILQLKFKNAEIITTLQWDNIQPVIQLNIQALQVKFGGVHSFTD